MCSSVLPRLPAHTSKLLDLKASLTSCLTELNCASFEKTVVRESPLKFVIVASRV